MPRRPRIVYDNSTVYLTQRGNNRSACFFTDEDYAFYLEQLALASKARAVNLHAYALMPGEVHVLLSAKDGQAPSGMMKQLSQRYVQYINRTYQRSGTLWEGRFRSCIVGGDEYVMHCHRYIEQSPRREGLTNELADYRWSSYHTNALDKPADMLTPHPFIRSLGAHEAERKESYKETLTHDLPHAAISEIESAISGNLVLGSEQFQRKIGKALQLRTWRGKAGRPKRKS